MRPRHLAGASLLAWALVSACGDDEAPAATATATSASTGAAGASGGGGGSEACALPGIDNPTECTAACEILYDCGALACDGAKLCPGFSGDAAERAAFVGDEQAGCTQGCNTMPAVTMFIKPHDCAATIDLVKAGSAEIAAVCEGGFGGGSG